MVNSFIATAAAAHLAEEDQWLLVQNNNQYKRQVTPSTGTNIAYRFHLPN